MKILKFFLPILVIVFLVSSSFAQSRYGLSEKGMAVKERYAELYIPDTTYTLELTQYVWTKVINFTADHLTSEMTFADDSLTIGVAGTYVFGVSIAFEGGINGVYKGTVVVNSVIDSTHVFLRKTGAAASVGSASLLEMRDINAGDGISLWVENIGNNTDIVICAVGFVIRRLGD